MSAVTLFRPSSRDPHVVPDPRRRGDPRRSSPLRALAARALCAVPLALLAACASPPAQAVGNLSDVTIVDRDSGRTLPVYRHGGRLWVAGRPGVRYAIALRNRDAERLLAVMSVDGVNVISGDTADWGQTGYVLSPQGSYQITGWRKSDREVAAFEFGALADSYAARTGRPADVGVIGVALFREQARPVIAPPRPAAPGASGASGAFGALGESGASGAASSSAPSAASGIDSGSVPAPAPGASRAESAAADAARAAPGSVSPRSRLGTGHGAREQSTVSHTSFERRRDTPDEVITLFYDSAENLVAMGVLPRPQPLPRPPRPFPRSPADSGYVPDPS